MSRFSSLRRNYESLSVGLYSSRGVSRGEGGAGVAAPPHSVEIRAETVETEHLRTRSPFFWSSLNLEGNLVVERREDLFLVFTDIFSGDRNRKMPPPPLFKLLGTPLSSLSSNYTLLFLIWTTRKAEIEFCGWLMPSIHCSILRTTSTKIITFN